MNYGCIGERLKHSFSKEIHNSLAPYKYELCEVAKEDLERFMKSSDFKAINVTIPYKEKVIPYLYKIDAHAQEIGAVNTVVNRGGKLYGYNTDFYGMSMLFSHAGIDVKGKKVLILGTGGTSKTARAVTRALGAKETVTVSRTKSDFAVDYKEAYAKHSDADIIVNTTPVGMYPACYDTPIDISVFPNLSGVIDAIYNPLRTPLVSEAKKRGIKAEGGLYMLVAQAVRASEIFTDCTYPDGTCEKVYNSLLLGKENIVLIGMPASGKSTVGACLCDLLKRKLYDTDSIVIDNTGMDIPKIFSRYGEDYFRDEESRAVREAGMNTSAIVATGGGVILREENVDVLKQNGRVFFLDRPLELLIPTKDRPLSSTKEAITKRFEERYPVYLSLADERIDASGSIEEVANKIIDRRKML